MQKRCVPQKQIETGIVEVNLRRAKNKADSETFRARMIKNIQWEKQLLQKQRSQSNSKASMYNSLKSTKTFDPSSQVKKSSLPDLRSPTPDSPVAPAIIVRSTT